MCAVALCVFLVATLALCALATRERWHVAFSARCVLAVARPRPQTQTDREYHRAQHQTLSNAHPQRRHAQDDDASRWENEVCIFTVLRRALLFV
jgi:hypothetical protein